MEQLDVWSLVQSGDFEKACLMADQEYSQTKDIFPLRNKVYALLHLKKYQEAVLLTQKLIELRNGETDVDFIFCGIANWLLNRKTEAIQLWHNAEHSIYKDAAGGIDIQTLLYFASVKTRDIAMKADAQKKLRKLLRSKASLNWPGPLGSFLIGDIPEDILLSSSSHIPILRERQLCQGYFTIAVKELEKGDADGYREKLKASISYGPPSYLALFYYLAKGELEIGCISG